MGFWGQDYVKYAVPTTNIGRTIPINFVGIGVSCPFTYDPTRHLGRKLSILNVIPRDFWEGSC